MASRATNRSTENGQRLGSILSQEKYIRERLNPMPGDSLYLHLSDLRLWMDRIATTDRLKILDFGCGGSPYRSLFPNSDYLRADIAETPNIDFVISEDAPILPISDDGFDLILSSQVLEHVPRPLAYLQECKRLLRAGGRLVLSTHGVYEEHGVPYDFQRWTEAGLSKIVSESGFCVDEIWKMTTGPRAALYLLEQHFPNFDAYSRFGLFFRPMEYVVRRRPWWLHRSCDELLGHHRVVVDGREKHKLYIGIGCIATARKF